MEVASTFHGSVDEQKSPPSPYAKVNTQAFEVNAKA